VHCIFQLSDYNISCLICTEELISKNRRYIVYIIILQYLWAILAGQRHSRHATTDIWPLWTIYDHKSIIKCENHLWCTRGRHWPVWKVPVSLMLRLTKPYTLYIHSNKPPTFTEGQSPREKISRGVDQLEEVVILNNRDRSYCLALLIYHIYYIVDAMYSIYLMIHQFPKKCEPIQVSGGVNCRSWCRVLKRVK
jgi:hypothetical protein